jgi:hypothetical protein
MKWLFFAVFAPWREPIFCRFCGLRPRGRRRHWNRQDISRKAAEGAKKDPRESFASNRLAYPDIHDFTSSEAPVVTVEATEAPHGDS